MAIYCTTKIIFGLCQKLIFKLKIGFNFKPKPKLTKTNQNQELSTIEPNPFVKSNWDFYYLVPVRTMMVNLIIQFGVSEKDYQKATPTKNCIPYSV